MDAADIKGLKASGDDAEVPAMGQQKRMRRVADYADEGTAVRQQEEELSNGETSEAHGSEDSFKRAAEEEISRLDQLKPAWLLPDDVEDKERNRRTRLSDTDYPQEYHDAQVRQFEQEQRMYKDHPSTENNLRGEKRSFPDFGGLAPDEELQKQLEEVLKEENEVREEKKATRRSGAKQRRNGKKGMGKANFDFERPPKSYTNSRKRKRARPWKQEQGQEQDGSQAFGTTPPAPPQIVAKIEKMLNLASRGATQGEQRQAWQRAQSFLNKGVEAKTVSPEWEAKLRKGLADASASKT